MEGAHQKEAYLEEVWYAFAILEDRLVSMIKQSGDPAGPRWTMGRKIKLLETRAQNDVHLKGALLNLDLLLELLVWAEDERNLMAHHLAKGNLTLELIDKKSLIMANRGKKLVKHFCAAARRYKKQKKKQN